ncbi:MAG: hypothetical protein ACRDWW_04930, partial [Acidimicrobiales bacterium]
SETTGIAGSVGVFAVPCDIYCSYFDLAGGHDSVHVVGNTISFPEAATGATGIWAGDAAASSSGTVRINISANTISGAARDIVLGPTANGHGGDLHHP